MEKEEKRYPSDLTDREWAILEPLVPPPKPGGHPRTVNIREVVNDIFYVLCGDIPWRFLPKDFPPWQTVYYYFWVWRREGVLERMNTVLREKERVRVGREPTPSARIIDSQSVKTTERGAAGLRRRQGGDQMMKQRLQCCFRWIALLLVPFLIGTGCSWMGFELRRIPTPSPEPVIIPTPIPTPSPEPVIIPTPIPTLSPESGTETPLVPSSAQEAVLYEDDFTNPASGWPNELVFDNYYIGYHEPEYYHVEVRGPNNRAVVVLPERSFDDFVAEAEVFVSEENTAASGDFRYGLVVRRSGEQYYSFTISPHTKTWSVLKSSPSGLEVLDEGTENSIQVLDADMLRVGAKGPDFTFHINGRPVSRVNDADYVNGEVGFMVETFDSPRAHFHYDSLVIRKFEMPPPSDGMVRIEDGRYKVGSSKPDDFHTASKEIRVAAFWIDIYEVRNAHYKEFLDTTGHSQPPNWLGETFPSGWEDHPVKGVTWDQASAYCDWANKRLPTEAEWEVAARGPGPEPPLYPWGSDSQAGGDVNQLPLIDTYEVGTMPFNKSAFDVYDMAGNVWEWVGEPYAPVPDGYKVLRGGRHGFLKDMTYRQSVEPNDNSFLPFTGFRCAADFFFPQRGLR